MSTTEGISVPPKFIFESTFYPEIVPPDRILSEPFLAACNVVVDFLAMLGGTFSLVKADISGHIEKVKKLVVLDTQKFKYLDVIIDPRVEVDNKLKKCRQEAITSLTWLKRSCEYILHFLSKFTHPDNLSKQDLRPLFRDAYELKLKMHHNFVAQKIFQVCVYAAPNRSRMIDVLTGKGDRSEQQVYNIISVFLKGMEANVECLIRTFNKYGQQQ